MILSALRHSVPTDDAPASEGEGFRSSNLHTPLEAPIDRLPDLLQNRIAALIDKLFTHARTALLHVAGEYYIYTLCPQVPTSHVCASYGVLHATRRWCVSTHTVYHVKPAESCPWCRHE